MKNLLIYNHLMDNEYLKECLTFLLTKENEQHFISLMIEASEKYNLHDHLFQSLLTYLLANDENAFTLSLEREKDVDDYLERVVLHDLDIIYDLFHYDFSFLNDLYKDLFGYNNNAQNDKKERVLTMEIGANNDTLYSYRQSRLEERQKFADLINSKYGLSVSVEIVSDSMDTTPQMQNLFAPNQNFEGGEKNDK